MPYITPEQAPYYAVAMRFWLRQCKRDGLPPRPDLTASADRLGVAEPAEWPPLNNDADSRAWFRRELQTNLATSGWMAYYVVAEIDGVPRWLAAPGQTCTACIRTGTTFLSR